MKKTLPCVIALCITTTIVQATDDVPIRLLKGVTAVKYSSLQEQPFAEDSNDKTCTVDWDAWKTAIDFVANQSNKLKLIPAHTHWEISKELYAKVYDPNRHPMFDEAAEHEARKYGFMPWLRLILTSADAGVGCFGEVKAEVSALAEDAKLMFNDKIASHPSVEMWSRSRWLKAPYSSFSSLVVRNGETMMKSFVNVWEASQSLP